MYTGIWMENFAFYQKFVEVLSMENLLPYAYGYFWVTKTKAFLKNICKTEKAVLFVSHVCFYVTKINFRNRLMFLKLCKWSYISKSNHNTVIHVGIGQMWLTVVEGPMRIHCWCILFILLYCMYVNAVYTKTVIYTWMYVSHRRR